ncbi:sugar transferase [Alteribacillus bidgolensis]|uniref:Sugar transferase involved in LPS biosynthesis (Colanic, teichoic acid) n=1 Tax=Alteribacillus bidgolensis TaxID=930129 RepID=A0A1G8PP51_9BACI|nr:sugar transferase [Alteribacillus bidgolensis]SDI94281.1 Sugar transferase involved in LPS biosynthesis (colanic, teichoic acid) [Alteribacillus bidgolensis]
MKHANFGFYRNYFKRLIDFTLSLIAIILLSPLFLIIAVVIKLDSKGPVLFIQERAGLNNSKFRIYKFRTMVNNADRLGSGLRTSKNDVRITKVGNILRKTSLDEIPQLINILKGDMSIVGPRPTVEKVTLQLSKDDLKRHIVRPGITGLAQVNGRQSLNWAEKIKYDLKYVDHLTFLVDFKILIKTILVVFKQDSVHKEEISKEFKNL